jgi:hypothetical protein
LFTFGHVRQLDAVAAGLLASASAPSRVRPRSLGQSSAPRSTELSALLFGVGVGAIIQVIIQIAPGLRTRGRRLLAPAVIGGLAAGVAVMYLTGRLVAA